ncbi:MAG: patatin-like phospholipase family protein [Crocinitomicaceae bacterium]|nr:patatin-like phospholipase family protein [Crocinitomicaceae bacterium]
MQFKKNLLTIIFWSILFGFITNAIASKYGVPYLFLAPEYLGQVGVYSFILLGFATGGFIMAFHTYSYSMLGPLFPFLATLHRPFFKFCVNNSTIPLIYIITFIVKMILFQLEEELISFWPLFFNIIGFLIGNAIFILLSMLYFFRVNKNVITITGGKEKSVDEPINTTFNKPNPWYSTFMRKKTFHPDVYIGSRFRLKKSRDISHYDEETIQKVFSQNHFNASYFEIAMVLGFFALGIFRDISMFVIPAGASILLLFTIFLMIISAAYSWFKGWTFAIMFSAFLLFNFLSYQIPWLQSKSYVFGLQYSGEPVPYNLKVLEGMIYNKSSVQNDYENQLQTMEHWKNKTGEEKPKLIVINCSGGGLRSALWTFTVLQHIYKNTDGQFFKNVKMITGASGGMIGAAYFRELYLKEKLGEIESLADEKYRDNIAKDLLNFMSFTIATNDIFIRYQKVYDGQESYIKDRGYSFEQNLNENTEFVLDKRLEDYEEPEYYSKIPQLVLTPTIINDGRRLIISSSPMNFVNRIKKMSPRGLPKSYENVEFAKLLEAKEPMRTKFTSALRLNATFPYIMPMVSLPTNPSLEIMDAGLRDNYGGKFTADYLLALKDWIDSYTSGVILLEIRDTQKDYHILSDKGLSLIDKLLMPLGNFYGNFPRAQDFDRDEMMVLLNSGFEIPFHVVSFNLKDNPKEKISLSWHLTTREKHTINDAIFLERNQKELEKLITLLKQK